MALKTFSFQRSIWMEPRSTTIRYWAGPLVRVGAVSGAFLLAAGCAGPVKSLYPPGLGEKPRSVYVVHHGTLHTGLAVKRSDIPPGLWPAHRDYAQFKHLEIGWGDDDGYRRPLTTGIALKALAGSRRTVLLADGFNAVREKVKSPAFTVIQVDLSERGFARLCRHIEQTYATTAPGGRSALERDGIARRAPTPPSAPATPGLRKACARPVVPSPRPTASRRVPSSGKSAASDVSFDPDDFQPKPRRRGVSSKFKFSY